MSEGASHTKVLMLLDNPLHSDLRVEKEADSLIKHGFDVTVFAISPKAEPGEETLANGLKVKRFQCALIHPLRKSYHTTIAPVLQAIEQTSFDILHCHDFLTLVIGGIVKEKHPDTFLTYDSHEYFRGLPYYQNIPNPWNRFKGWINYRYLCRKEREVIRQADCVVTTTTAIAQRLMGDNGLGERPLVVENVSTLQPQNDPTSNLRTMLNIAPEKHILVHSGNIYQSDEQLRQLFHAVKKRDDLIIVMIGNKPRYFEVKQRFESSNDFRDVLHFVEYDSNKLFDMLASADFGMLHTGHWVSHKITSPNRVMEYLLCGIPVLSVHQQAVAELDQRFDIAVFYDDRKPGSLENALQEMVSDLKHKKEKAKVASQQMDWNKNISGLIQRYEQVKSNT